MIIPIVNNTISGLGSTQQFQEWAQALTAAFNYTYPNYKGVKNLTDASFLRSIEEAGNIPGIGVEILAQAIDAAYSNLAFTAYLNQVPVSTTDVMYAQQPVINTTVITNNDNRMSSNEKIDLVATNLVSKLMQLPIGKDFTAQLKFWAQNNDPDAVAWANSPEIQKAVATKLSTGNNPDVAMPPKQAGSGNMLGLFLTLGLVAGVIGVILSSSNPELSGLNGKKHISITI